MTYVPWQFIIALLALIAAVGAGCFWAGWRSAKSYLTSANSVLAVTKAIAEQSNGFNDSLDKYRAEATLLREAVNHNTRVAGEKLGQMEAAVVALHGGLERAGVSRAPRTTPGRQVGEAEEE